jgi:hypothetical protein
MSVYSSTYRNVVKSLGDLILAHPAVKTFRVGPPSDIEMPTDTKPEIKYPYVHLVPQPAVLNGRSTIFDFDMVVMDLAKDTEELETFAQSAMLEITRDIIAQYTNTTWDQWRFNLEMPVTSTPFVENFVNSVSGWTSQIRIEAITPISNCENPVTTYPQPSNVIVYSQQLVFDPFLNSINYKCNGVTVHSCYGANEPNITDLVAMFNANPPVQGNACFLDYGTYYDNGDGRVRLEMPSAVYNTLCPNGTLTLEVIYD